MGGVGRWQLCRRCPTLLHFARSPEWAQGVRGSDQQQAIRAHVPMRDDSYITRRRRSFAGAEPRVALVRFIHT